MSLTSSFCPYCGSSLVAGVPTCPACGSTLQPGGQDLPAGASLRGGQYVIQSVLGRGGFGITYAAVDTSFNALVAVKELFPGEGTYRGPGGTVAVTQAAQPEFGKLRERFKSEAQVLLGLRHPAIVRVLAIFEENATAYLVMEHLAGETLQSRLDREGRIGEDLARALLARVLGALEEVHGSGLLHRDVKPENVMLTPKGPVLIDFGTALEFTPGRTALMTSRVLTPAYAPLEQYATAAHVGPPTDLYALGATFYHALTGTRPPSSMDRAAGVALRSLRAIVPGVTQELARVIEKALELKVGDRYQSAREMLSDLHPAAVTAVTSPTLASATVPTSSSPTVVVQGSAPTVQAAPRRRAVWPSLVLTLALVVVIGWAGTRLLANQASGETPANEPGAETAASGPASEPTGRVPEAAAAAASWSPDQAEVTATLLNVRSGPNADSPSLTAGDGNLIVKRGQTLSVLAEQDGWYEVNASGREGWVRSRWTLPVGPLVPREAIEELTSAAAAGTPLRLLEGVYLLPGTLDLADGAQLLGAGTERTFLIGAGDGPAVAMRGPGARRLSDLTVGLRAGAVAPVVVAEDASPTLERVRLVGGRDRDNNPDGDEGDGLVLHGGTTATVDSSEFVANDWRGISVHESSSLTLTGSRLLGNDGSGLVLYDGAHGDVRDVTADGNGLQGVKVMNQASASITGSTFSNNGGGAFSFLEQASGSASGNSCEGELVKARQVEAAAPTMDLVSLNNGCSPPASTASGESLANGWTRYVEPDVGLSVTVPAGWKRTVDKGSDYLRVKFSLGQYLYVMLDRSLKAPPASVSDDWYELDASFTDKYGPKYEQLSIVDDTLGGYPASSWEFLLDRDDQPALHKLDIGVIKGSRALAVLFVAPSGSWYDYADTFNSIRESIEIQ